MMLNRLLGLEPLRPLGRLKGGRVHCWIVVVLAIGIGLELPVAEACTTAVISGRITHDGRPILWKNRDTSNSRNEVVLLTDGPLRAIAVVNAGSRKSVWMGMNEAGFCIENSLSTDLQGKEKSRGPSNGPFMKLALQRCRTVEDFRKLLEETNKTGRQTVANFGVIDAEGGAAMFEAGPREFTMFDANDPKVAPEGYLVRSNFATTAQQLAPQPDAEDVKSLRSGARYVRACSLLNSIGSESISVEFVLRQMTRDMSDVQGEPFPGTVNRPAGEMPESIPTAETISRNTTVSAAVFAGVRPGEDPHLTTMWTILGDPKVSIAIPCWVDMEAVADPLADVHGGEVGEIARTLRDSILVKGSTGVATRNLPGIWTDLWAVEDQLLKTTTEALSLLRSAGPASDETAIPDGRRTILSRLHQEAARQAYAAMQIELNEAKSIQLTGSAHEKELSRWPVRAETVRVAIYDHSGGQANGPKNLLRFLTPQAGFACERVDPQAIRDGCLQRFDVLIMPGGSGSGQSKRLEASGREAVRKFVADGGGYVGICAGSYLASNHYSWSLGLINANVWDRAHWARGTGAVTLNLHPQAAAQWNVEQAKLDVYYGQGPLLVPGDHPDLPKYEVLARYSTEVAKKGAATGAMSETHAIIRSEFGRGRVICFSPHPETANGPNEIMAAGVRWAASPELPTGSARTTNEPATLPEQSPADDSSDLDR